jgi:hypothetical protein
MNALFGIVFGLLGDLVGRIALAFGPRQGSAAEIRLSGINWRRTKDRSIKLRRVDVRSRRPNDKQALKPSTPIRRLRSEAAHFNEFVGNVASMSEVIQPGQPHIVHCAWLA